MNAYSSILALALAVALATGAQAQLPDITYDGITASYTRVNIDDADEDADAFTLSGTFEIGGNFHVWGWIERTAFDQAYDVRKIVELPAAVPAELKIPPLEMTVRTLAAGAGAGAHYGLTDRLSAYARLGVVYTDIEIEGRSFEVQLPSSGNPARIENIGTVNETSTDPALSAGLRFRASERVELFAGASQVDFEDGTAHAGVEFRLGGGLGLQLAGVLGENSKGLSARAVWRF